MGYCRLLYCPSHNSSTKPEQLLYECNSKTSLFHTCTRIFQPDQNKRQSQKTHLFAQLSNRLGGFARLQGLLYFILYLYQAGMSHMANTWAWHSGCFCVLLMSSFSAHDTHTRGERQIRAHATRHCKPL